MGLEKVYCIYDKYSKYEYINEDMSTYHIKNSFELDKSNGGICWDFMRGMSLALHKASYIHHCYFTEVQRDNKTIATHTYIIIRDGVFKYWIECAWDKHKGVNLIFSYKDVERLLKDEYNADELHTVVYDPMKVEGMTANEFFEYLNKYGVILS